MPKLTTYFVGPVHFDTFSFNDLLFDVLLIAILYIFIGEEASQGFLKLLSKEGRKYILRDNRSLNYLFGDDWFIRFHNEYGDCAFVINGSLSATQHTTVSKEWYYCKVKKTFLTKSSQTHCLKIRFVRGETNFTGYKNGECYQFAGNI